MEFSRQEYWSGQLFPSPGDLSDSGIEPRSPALAGRFFTTKPPGKPSTEYRVGIQQIKQFSCSIAQLCPTLCNPMNCSMPGFPVLHQLPELPWCSSGQWCHRIISSSLVPFSSCLQSFPASGSFPWWSQFFALGGQSIGVSASASVLPMNIQDWFPLGWTGWISLQSKGLSRVFFNTTVQKHQFLALSFLYSSTFTSIHDYWKNHSWRREWQTPSVFLRTPWTVWKDKSINVSLFTYFRRLFHFPLE